MPNGRSTLPIIALLTLSLCTGCMTIHRPHRPWFDEQMPAHGKDSIKAASMPRELAKTALPEYVIEPPDILLIDAIQVIPKPPYHLHALDTVLVQVQGTLPEYPIDGMFAVESGGVINFGQPYGSVKVVGMTLDEAVAAIETHLGKALTQAVVTVQLGETIGQQQIAGEHLVGPDGKVSLGTYGKVFVAGLTQDEAKTAIETQLSKQLEGPEVSVEIYAYNSKFYYVYTQGAGLGDQLLKFSITGNETVLDAIAEIQGLDSVSSKRIWISRPAPDVEGGHLILPVDWNAVTELGSSSTNYQLMPGDRVFVAEDPLVAVDTVVSKIISPFERVAGFVSLGTQTVSGIRFFKSRGTRGGATGF
ncbi:MAG: polysaccharide biosynthesis/export family protein [Planctomycetia bacterium]|nr:polysaccharide biosynthesis/export family protein [Planctomycetia bacterium]